MKLLVILATVALFVWLLRGDRRRAVKQARPAPGLAGPQAMVGCATCGLHLPVTEALAGPDGRHYCCTEHRRAAR